MKALQRLLKLDNLVYFVLIAGIILIAATLKYMHIHQSVLDNH